LYNSSVAKYNISVESIPTNIVAGFGGFTKEELTPSEKTLNIIRQIAYTYRAMKINGKLETYFLN